MYILFYIVTIYACLFFGIPIYPEMFFSCFSLILHRLELREIKWIHHFSPIVRCTKWYSLVIPRCNYNYISKTLFKDKYDKTKTSTKKITIMNLMKYSLLSVCFQACLFHTTVQQFEIGQCSVLSREYIPIGIESRIVEWPLLNHHRDICDTPHDNTAFNAACMIQQFSKIPWMLCEPKWA